MAAPTHYTVTDSFVGHLNGAEVEYHAGEVVPADDPAIKKMPNHFAPLVLRAGTVRAVEQATSAPGEKRRLSIRRKAKEPELELEPEPEPAAGKAITTDSFKGR